MRFLLPAPELSAVREAKGLHDEYIQKDCHQPNDEFEAAWNSEAPDDRRFLAEHRWRIANSRTAHAYHQNEQFARPRQTTSR